MASAALVSGLRTNQFDHAQRALRNPSACPDRGQPVNRCAGRGRHIGAYNTDVRVQNITVRVPRTLRVSEGNGYLPSTDIVWRGDPIGDRYAQIGAIFFDAMRKGTEALNGATPVFMDIEVTRFSRADRTGALYHGGGAQHQLHPDPAPRHDGCSVGRTPPHPR